MIAYGKCKRGSGKIHPHNECSICAENNVIKKRDRMKINRELNRMVRIANRTPKENYVDSEHVIKRLYEYEPEDK